MKRYLYWALPLLTAGVLWLLLAGNARSAQAPSGPALGILRANTGSSTVTGVTQMQGLPPTGMAWHITDLIFSNGATAQTVQLVSSTTAGNACGTSQVAEGPPITLDVNHGLSKQYDTPLAITANSALCCKNSGSTAFSCEVLGYYGP